MCIANYLNYIVSYLSVLHNINSVTVKLMLGRIYLHGIILKANQMNYFLPCNFIRTTDLFEPWKTKENIHMFKIKEERSRVSNYFTRHCTLKSSLSLKGGESEINEAIFGSLKPWGILLMNILDPIIIAKCTHLIENYKKWKWKSESTTFP